MDTGWKYIIVLRNDQPSSKVIINNKVELPKAGLIGDFCTFVMSLVERFAFWNVNSCRIAVGEVRIVLCVEIKVCKVTRFCVKERDFILFGQVFNDKDNKN